MLTFKIFLLELYFVFVLSQIISDSNYGPYVLRFTNFTVCKGPKNHDCGKLEFNISSSSDGKSLTKLHTTFNIYKDCPLMQVKSQVSSVQSNNLNKLFSYNIHKPCGHFFFGPYLRSRYNVTNHCVLKKGTYNTVVDLDQMTRRFYGNRFFYGTYTFKNIGFNLADNVFCAATVITFERVV